MALRAFRANPSLGGFGGESSGGPLRVNSQATEQDCDAFSQIIKELTDNAVDACQQSRSNDTTSKRIRVVIEQMNNEHDEEYTEANHVLRVTVSDNGIGMENIQDCVNAFRTSKAGNGEENEETVENTAGRYGIGLTLCLLHAQRLVPDSCASITSATREALHFTRASYVVDTDGDSVLCVKQEELPKTSPEESGTAVSLLVPGGATAARSWPRLAEYFARFQLSLGLQCGLEVLAPSLSTIPLYIRPASQRGNRQSSSQASPLGEPMEDEDEAWTDGLSDLLEVPGSQAMQDDDADEVMSDGNASKNANNAQVDARRLEILKAANTFLKKPIEIKNVAHSVNPIGRVSRHNQDAQPTLEVDLIIYGPGDGDDSLDGDGSLVDDVLATSPSAKLMLVRMVNGVPLLDGAEATACGLVQGIVQKQSTWNSFGLHVSPATSDRDFPFEQNDDSSADTEDDHADSGMPGELFVPTYDVRDSDQVAPFIRRNTHDLYDMDNEDDGSASSGDDGSARGGRRDRNGFLPAHLRLGNILLVVQIHAKPSSLPLPTLSKGRLPMNNHPIGSALELGIMECLTSLQKTSPGMLLTSTQLKETIRDIRYIPALSAALALLACKSQNTELKTSMLQTIQRWSQDNVAQSDQNGNPVRNVPSQQDETGSDDGSMVQNDSMEESTPPALVDLSSADDATAEDDDSTRISTLGPLLEARLRLVCTKKNQPCLRNSRRGEGGYGSDSDDAVSLDEFLQGEPELAPADSQMQDDEVASARESFTDGGLSVSSSSSLSTEPAVPARITPTSGRHLDSNEDDFDDDSWF